MFPAHHSIIPFSSLPMTSFRGACWCRHSSAAYLIKRKLEYTVMLPHICLIERQDKKEQEKHTSEQRKHMYDMEVNLR